MFTEFSMCENFLKSKYFNDVDLSITHDLFLNNWRSYGVLVASDDQITDYRNAIDMLPPKFKNKWKLAFSNGRFHHVLSDVPRIEAMMDFEQAKSLRSLFSTAFLEETLSYQLCGNGELARCCDETCFELVGAPVFTESMNMKRSVSACGSDISEADEIGAVWAKCFRNLARYSKRIFISDRYLFSRILGDHGRGVSSTNIKNFFSFLSSEGGHHYVTLASDGGADSSQAHTELANYFEVLFKRHPEYKSVIKRLTLISTPDVVFQQYSHDRYVRFEEHVCELGNGMALFERHPLSNMTLNIKLQGQTNSAEIEKALRNDPCWTAVLIN